MTYQGLLGFLACIAIAVTAIVAQPTPADARRGAVVGGLVGAGVGAAVTRGRAGGVIGGALIGGVIGNQIEKNNRYKRRRYR